MALFTHLSPYKAVWKSDAEHNVKVHRSCCIQYLVVSSGSLQAYAHLVLINKFVGLGCAYNGPSLLRNYIASMFKLFDFFAALNIRPRLLAFKFFLGHICS